MSSSEEEGFTGNDELHPENRDDSTKDMGSGETEFCEGNDSKVLSAKNQKRFESMVVKERKKGVCYLSRIPPHMKPLKLRHLLEPFGEVLRIYLAPEENVVRLRRKKAGGNRGKNFTEGWVEFARKKVAKRVAQLLNGEPMDPKKRSAYHYDLWNIKYLHKFKWDNLTEEIAYRNAVREEKLRTEISKATKERDFYLSKVDQSKAISAMAERKKKRKVEGGESEETEELSSQKVLRRFSQRTSVKEAQIKDPANLSSDVLKTVLGT